ncbi:uncharacterized protein LOC131995966 [Stomoxys calcitrans]|uniref:uncharacterized protein LOC131995028 n=1 Tax=Stomoxys calcitrans TaxID=35570 RepID=UPI0027E3211D|nr:uncharacterized protein LOC131995028 [Stomoxys calcitrans]XP_059221299.1 uncharacterized protein LOC131995966 [Stomoxys calcitrans]
MQRTPPHTPAAATQQTITGQSSKRNRLEVSPGNLSDTPVASSGLSQLELIKVITNTINSNLDEKLKTLSTKADIAEVKMEIGAINSELNHLRLENQQLKTELIKVKRECEETKKDMIWMQEQIRSNKVLIRGLNASNEPAAEINNLFTNKLQISPVIKYARKIFERNGKMNVVVEFNSHQGVDDVFRNVRKLIGSNIYIERDLIPTKRQIKKASLLLKYKIMAISKQHRIIVQENKLKIKDTWFHWDREHKLMAGKNDAKHELLKLYGDCMEQFDTDYETLLTELNSKN